MCVEVFYFEKEPLFKGSRLFLGGSSCVPLGYRAGRSCATGQRTVRHQDRVEGGSTQTIGMELQNYITHGDFCSLASNLPGLQTQLLFLL